MSEVPGHKKKWHDSKWVPEAFAGIPAVGAAVYAAFAASTNPAIPQLVPRLLAALAIWLCVVTIWKIRNARLEEQSQSPSNPLFAAMCVVRELVVFQAGLPQQAGTLRVTMHRVVDPYENPREIEQLTPYAGGDGRGRPGRRFPIQAGVAGRAATTKKLAILQLEKSTSNQARITGLTELGYTDQDAQGIVGSDRLSFLAVPIFGKHGNQGPVIGVVYFDSVVENAFTPHLELIVGACGGITSYISQRYG